MTLYKYFDPARFDVIDGRYIRFTPPHDFNDPFEFKPVISTVASQEEFEAIFKDSLDRFVDEELAKMPAALRKLVSRDQVISMSKKSFSDNRNFMSEKLKELGKRAGDIFNDKSNELVGVLCLTEKPDNLLMWSHYAESHQGFCIGFDASSPFFSRKRGPKDEFYHLRKVSYFPERPIKRLLEMNGTDLLLAKSDIWEYEQEWRMCAVLEDCDLKKNIGSLDICLFKFPSKSIQEIILGVNIDGGLKKDIISLVDNDSDLSHVKIRQAVISETKYALEFEDL